LTYAALITESIFKALLHCQFFSPASTSQSRSLFYTNKRLVNNTLQE